MELSEDVLKPLLLKVLDIVHQYSDRLKVGIFQSNGYRFYASSTAHSTFFPLVAAAVIYLERRVERAFVEAGKALMELRDRRLYRSTHRTFEEYCRDRFNYSHNAAYLKISAALMCENIQKFLPTNGRQNPMPTNERQLRDLTKAES